MLDKKSCVKCHQKHEAKWDEEVWQDGYVNCPSECFGVYKDGDRVPFEDIGGNAFVRAVFGLHATTEDAPLYCEFVHGRIPKGLEE